MRPFAALEGVAKLASTISVEALDNSTEVTSMTMRIFGFSLVSFVLGAALFAARITNVSNANVQDDRAADREAIRAHIDSIFQAFVKPHRFLIASPYDDCDN
jgi:hypothetical protein